MNVVVVGGGVFGLCTLLALSRLGLDCTLVEARRLLAGATGYSGGMVRLWHGDQRMVEWAKVGQQFWRQLPGYHQTGCLYFEAPGSSEPLPAGAHRLETDLGRERFPDFVWREGETAVYEPEAGWVDASVACQAMADRAQGLGAKIVEECEVLGLLGEGRVEGVKTSQGDLRADAVIWAGGPSGVEPLGETRLPELEKRPIQVVRLSGQFPQLPCFFDRTTLGFGRSIHGGSLWVGVGLRRTCEETVAAIDPEDTQRALEVVCARLPLVEGRQAEGGIRASDLYQADRTPLFGRSSRPGLYWAWCGSGGGFKVAPALADQLANQLVEELPCHV